MDKNRVQAEIRYLLENIKDQNQTIASYEGSIPSIELDLIMANIRRLYEQYRILTKMNDLQFVPFEARPYEEDHKNYEEELKNEPVSSPSDYLSGYKAPVDPVTPNVEKEEPALMSKEPVHNVESFEFEKATANESVSHTEPEPEKEVISTENNNPTYNEDEPVDEELVQQELLAELKKAEQNMDPEIAEQLNKIRNYIPSVETQKEEPKQEQVEKKVEPHTPVQPPAPSKQEATEPATQPKDEVDNLTVADKFTDDKRSIYDQMSGKGGATIADRINKGNPISNLNSSIGLNDKFAFINDLFKGSMAEYSAAIEEINSKNSIAEANEVFRRLWTKYDWNDQSDSFLKLEEYINRRF